MTRRHTAVVTARHATLRAARARYDSHLADAIRDGFQTGATAEVRLRAGHVARTARVVGRTVTETTGTDEPRTWTRGEVVACLQRRFGAELTEEIRR